MSDPSEAQPSAVAEIGTRRLELIEGDITRQRVDAIANAANAALAGGGGVDGAIHAAAGPGLMAELRTRYPQGTPTGTAVATAAGNLAARWVLHAVGPRWHDGEHGEADLLAAAYAACLQLCDELGAQSVAFPAISLGIYGYPRREGAEIALRTVSGHLRGQTTLKVARFVLYSAETLQVFRAALAGLGETA
jgi:O-acetyl-ADP-ribose deacetylase (regulator of RNase III)